MLEECTNYIVAHFKLQKLIKLIWAQMKKLGITQRQI